MSGLKFAERGPRSGRARSMVVFLHGYGADGADLLGLADPLAPYLPDTLFVSPDAPERCKGTPFGRQWFPIPWLDGSSEAEMMASIARSVATLDAFLDDRLAAHGLAAGQMALFGFSQGTMMALQVGPRRPVQLAGIVGFSGRLMAPERLPDERVTTPPVLLLHGDQDPVVPFADLAAAERGLTAAGIAAETHVMRGAPHTITEDGLRTALGFLRRVLPG